MAPMLYLVPTPIGNLGDMTLRGAETLAAVDFIAAEDTRVTLKLLNHLELKKPMVSYYRHNMDSSGPKILERILAGESCALVTDAGTPAISDPGEELVALCVEAGVEVVALPGASAAITALSVSGLPTGRFTFEGFLATNRKNRAAHLDSLRREQRTMIFYEAPHKLPGTLEDLAEVFGAHRRISLCRELTKLHEQVLRTTLGEAAALYREMPPRGEFVLVIEGAPEQPEEIPSIEDAARRVLALRETGCPMKEAARQIAAATGLGKNELYALAVKTEKQRNNTNSII